MNRFGHLSETPLDTCPGRLGQTPPSFRRGVLSDLSEPRVWKGEEAVPRPGQRGKHEPLEVPILEIGRPGCRFADIAARLLLRCYTALIEPVIAGFFGPDLATYLVASTGSGGLR